LPHILYCYTFQSIPPPPRSPLFPYTTLFRSVAFAVTTFRYISLATNVTATRSPDWKPVPTTVAGAVEETATLARATEATAVPETDRKSTRLNSSHLGISYAVFCLKKKNVGGS